MLTQRDQTATPNSSAVFGRVILSVTEARAFADAAKEAGAAITRVIESRQPSVAAMVIMLTDPDGFVVELYQPTAEER